MVPHVFGWFTMTSVWFILFTQLEHARRDIHEVSDRNIPEWVFAAIIGTSLIFMSFALVRRARLNPPPPSQNKHALQLTHTRPRWQVQIIFQRARKRTPRPRPPARPPAHHSPHPVCCVSADACPVFASQASPPASTGVRRAPRTPNPSLHAFAPRPA